MGSILTHCIREGSIGCLGAQLVWDTQNRYNYRYNDSGRFFGYFQIWSGLTTPRPTILRRNQIV